MLVLFNSFSLHHKRKSWTQLPFSRYTTLKMEDRYLNILYYDCFIKDFGQRWSVPPSFIMELTMFPCFLPCQQMNIFFFCYTWYFFLKVNNVHNRKCLICKSIHQAAGGGTLNPSTTSPPRGHEPPTSVLTCLLDIHSGKSKSYWLLYL